MNLLNYALVRWIEQMSVLCSLNSKTNTNSQNLK